VSAAAPASSAASSTASTRAIAERARQLRRDVVTMIHRAGDGHPGGALSAADIVATLYFAVMRVDPARPRWPDRDRFVLSKGHACPVLYAALARRGYFDPAILPTLRTLGSPLQGHPDMRKTPGVDMTTGSLGHGISLGSGMAAAGRLQGRTFEVFVVTGDGELNEGLAWEGAASAARLALDRLHVFVDNNGWQSDGRVEDVSGMSGIARRFEAFGWHVQEIDGHDHAAIVAAVEAGRAAPGRPHAVVARTVKGKGVPFMEDDNSWHKRVPTAAELAEALAALGGDP
jgi:transketolase